MRFRNNFYASYGYTRFSSEPGDIIIIGVPNDLVVLPSGGPVYRPSKPAR